MFDRILVGIDRQCGGRDAIALAHALASEHAEYTFSQAHPAVGLAALAQQFGADLIVIGRGTRNRAGHPALGGATRSLVIGATCPVAVAPAGYAIGGHPLERIGVAYDGSAPSEAALAYARDLAFASGAEVSAFKVVPGPGPSITAGHSPRRVRRAQRSLVAARDQIMAHEDVEPHVACGEPVAQLAGYSATVDLLVAGARGAGALERLIRPSTTAALTELVHCPLLVLPGKVSQQVPCFTLEWALAHPEPTAAQ